jgi:hypothetical protein
MFPSTPIVAEACASAVQARPLPRTPRFSRLEIQP